MRINFKIAEKFLYQKPPKLQFLVYVHVHTAVS